MGRPVVRNFLGLMVWLLDFYRKKNFIKKNLILLIPTEYIFMLYWLVHFSRASGTGGSRLVRLGLTIFTVVDFNPRFSLFLDSRVEIIRPKIFIFRERNFHP